MICKKCNTAPGTVILRKKDSYCEDCFMINTNHKFRACIGKNKILTRNENVLICSSGGVASTVLLDLVNTGLSQDIHKKLRIRPTVLHIMEGADKEEESVVQMIIDQCKNNQMNLYIISITDYIQSATILSEPFEIPNINSQAVSTFQLLLQNLQSTAKHDFLLKIKHTLFNRVAQILKCNYIFTAETTTTLAVNLLSNLAIGRGSQVESDIGFCDSRNEPIKLLRPMKDISNEELNYYKNINKMVTCPTSINHQDNSLQYLIQSFVIDLQENFPATISTVCKTAEKIGFQENKQVLKKCSICQSNMDSFSPKLTALQATNFSQLVSHEKPRELSEQWLSSAPDKENMKIMFPFINDFLCYTCSRVYSDLDNSKLPNLIPK